MDIQSDLIGLLWDHLSSSQPTLQHQIWSVYAIDLEFTHMASSTSLVGRQGRNCCDNYIQLYVVSRGKNQYKIGGFSESPPRKTIFCSRPSHSKHVLSVEILAQSIPSALLFFQHFSFIFKPVQSPKFGHLPHQYPSSVHCILLGIHLYIANLL